MNTLGCAGELVDVGVLLTVDIVVGTNSNGDN